MADVALDRLRHLKHCATLTAVRKDQGIVTSMQVEEYCKEYCHPAFQGGSPFSVLPLPKVGVGDQLSVVKQIF